MVVLGCIGIALAFIAVFGTQLAGFVQGYRSLRSQYGEGFDRLVVLAAAIGLAIPAGVVIVLALTGWPRPHSSVMLGVLFGTLALGALALGIVYAVRGYRGGRRR